MTASADQFAPNNISGIWESKQAVRDTSPQTEPATWTAFETHEKAIEALTDRVASLVERMENVCVPHEPINEKNECYPEQLASPIVNKIERLTLKVLTQEARLSNILQRLQI